MKIPMHLLLEVRLDKIQDIISDMKKGKMVILVDDEDRENEGDLILASDHVSPEHINFMVKEARGLVCLTLTTKKVKQLELPLMVNETDNLSPNCTAFTVSIEASSGITTGISAGDRAHTIKVATQEGASAKDIIMPGHIFPIKAQDGGVLKRAGHTEASVDLARLAGLTPSAVICEIMNEDGSMARVPELKEFAKKFDIKIGTIADLIEYRLKNESFIEMVEKSQVENSELQLYTFKNVLNNQVHYAFVKGDPTLNSEAVVRVQKQNVLVDVFSQSIEGKPNHINDFMSVIAESQIGVFVYLTNDKDIGESGKDMEKRDYGVGAQILRKLGVEKLRLITNRPHSKLVALAGFGLEITETLKITDGKIQSSKFDQTNLEQEQSVVH